MNQSVLKKQASLAALPTRLPVKLRALMSKSVASLTPPIRGARFTRFFDQLDQELYESGLVHLQIEKYFGDEWFCPSGSTAIAIPFWLADEQLIQIERRFIGFVEGETDEDFMRLLRHEAGHCVDHAYGLSKRRDWQKIFGDPSIEYDPDAALTEVGHPDFVENLPGGYAQTHPDEDFAETFAVWLASDFDGRGRFKNWKSIYRHRPVALKKILYVDELMGTICDKKPKKLTNQKICNARRMRKSLEGYYLERIGSSKKYRELTN